ncbi:MAG: ABC transporter permease subunit [Candidatus Pacebacteria bacterium]|nr:ABC transporter permease subunit [Candidatus Paceibacterota bacterium]
MAVYGNARAPKTFFERAHFAIIPVVFVLLLLLALRTTTLFPLRGGLIVSASYIAGAFFATLTRLSIAYVLALTLAVPLVALSRRGPLAEKVLLPFFDVMQSIPVLAFFPLIAGIFLQFGFTDAAAVFVIFLSMLWNIVFSLVAGLKAIPRDISWAAKVFGVKGFAYARRVLLPAVTPSLIIGSLLAWAQGWNIIIVAEVLHTYIPYGTGADDLYGIGSVLVDSVAAGEMGTFATAVVFLVGAIALINFFVWQRLLNHAEKYRFE